jgi:hypothetical protein
VWRAAAYAAQRARAAHRTTRARLSLRSLLRARAAPHATSTPHLAHTTHTPSAPPHHAQAANYLNIKGLLDLTCQTVANMIKGAGGGCVCARVRARVPHVVLCTCGVRAATRPPDTTTPNTQHPSPTRARAHARASPGKTPEEIRKTFNIKNDFTPEQEEEVRRENQWAFD